MCFYPSVRALLLNIGYQEASQLFPWDCYIFHDVDLYPEDDRSRDNLLKISFFKFWSFCYFWLLSSSVIWWLSRFVIWWVSCLVIWWVSSFVIW